MSSSLGPQYKDLIIREWISIVNCTEIPPTAWHNLYTALDPGKYKIATIISNANTLKFKYYLHKLIDYIMMI